MKYIYFAIGFLPVFLIHSYLFSAEKNRNNNFQLEYTNADMSSDCLFLEKTCQKLDEQCQKILIIENFLKNSEGYIFPSDLHEDIQSSNEKSIKRKADNDLSGSIDKKNKKNRSDHGIFKKIWEIEVFEQRINEIKIAGFSHSSFESIQRSGIKENKKKATHFTPGDLFCIPRIPELFNVFSEEEKKRVLVLAQYLLYLKNARDDKTEIIEIDEELDLKAHLNNYNILIEKWIKKAKRFLHTRNRIIRTSKERGLL